MNENTVRFTMELLAAMMIYDMVQRDGISTKEALDAFMRSRTAEALFDPETGMWMNGPDYIYDYYKQERALNRRTQS